MQTPEHPAAAGQPARRSPLAGALATLLQPPPRAVLIEQLPRGMPLMYFDPAGQSVMVYARSPWDTRRHQVLVGSSPDADTLAVVDDFGSLVVTHRRDPASPFGMTMQAVA